MNKENPGFSPLGFDLTFSDFDTNEGLKKTDTLFLQKLQKENPSLYEKICRGRLAPAATDAKAYGALIIEAGPYLEDFLGEVFGIKSEIEALRQKTADLACISDCKRLFIQRQAVKEYQGALDKDGTPLQGEKIARILEEKIGAALTEENFAAFVKTCQQKDDQEGLDQAKKYGAWAVLTAAGQEKHGTGTLFKVPGKTDPLHLVHHLCEKDVDGVKEFSLPGKYWRSRDGFGLSDQGVKTPQALDQVNYCIFCGPQGKDSCSKGLIDRKNGDFQKSALGTVLTGCPLEEKISEMHTLRSQGFVLGAAAAVLIDNPMFAATGQRICNDCMSACIYQKQDPVNIPQTETSVLRDLLHLPWGFEIYALLSRWNPLNLSKPLPQEASGKAVLVTGAGPAGYTLAHYLLNDGHKVVLVDGLKIEPLGFDPALPIKDVRVLYDDLDERITGGFGGVAEYGITVRWNKNYLKLIRILLERRRAFSMFGGIRFGGDGTLSVDQAFALGFDHIALCLGAGRPTVLDIPNNLAGGVRQASDFLMSLQLTGAAKKSSLASLQLRLPVVVIGGGLTAMDAATESLTYYIRQVEKFSERYRILCREAGEEAVTASFSEKDCEIAREFLADAEAVAAERTKATAENREPCFIELLQKRGGAKVVYRRKLTQSPAYTLNHEEVEKTLEEGVVFVEELTPIAIETDKFEQASAVRFKKPDGSEVLLPARSVIVAAGTQPNTVLAREDSRVLIDGKYFQAVNPEGQQVTPEKAMPKTKEVSVLMHPQKDGRFMSFFGDLHPSFSGNVVRAMASAKRGYPVVSGVLEKLPAKTTETLQKLGEEAKRLFSAKVVKVERLTSNIIEITVKAPAAANAFQPGQFFRLQNFESFAPVFNEAGHLTRLAMEGVALTGASASPEEGTVSLIALEMGGSSNICACLKPGEDVILMGPTGTPTEIQVGKTVALIGGGLGNAVLFSIGQALRKAGSKVLYFAGYKTAQDRYKIEEIEKAADVIVWSCDKAPGFEPTRPQDRTFVGNIVESLANYGALPQAEQPIKLAEADELIVIGSDRMMQAVAVARHGVLKPYLKPEHKAVGSVNSPMQCMMKEVCAQCLQLHIDPKTGERKIVFTCFNQDQGLDQVDFPTLHERLGQNSLAEKLNALWLKRTVEHLEAAGKIKRI